MELKEKVLEARKRILGDEHPNTLNSMNNLASSYSELGRRQEAVELEEKVLEASRRTLGDEHPSTLVRMDNLAIMLSSQNCLTEETEQHVSSENEAFQTKPTNRWKLKGLFKRHHR